MKSIELSYLLYRTVEGEGEWIEEKGTRTLKKLQEQNKKFRV